MTTVDLAGDIRVDTGVTGLLFASTVSTNAPLIEATNVTQYFGDPAGASAIPSDGPDDSPNSGIELQPFFRDWMDISVVGVGEVGYTAVGWTYPTDLVVDDLAIMIIIHSPSDVVAPPGWTEVWRDQNNGLNRIWTHKIVDGDAGALVDRFFYGYSDLYVIGGIWGNAELDSVLANNIYTANSATAPQITIRGGGAGFFGWVPTRSYGNRLLQWSLPPDMINVRLTTTSAVHNYWWPGLAQLYPPIDTTITPQLISTTPEANFTGDVLNFSIALKGINVYPFATIGVEEGIGNGNIAPASQYIHLMAQDVHSPQIPYGYAEGAMNDTGTGVAYSYERWIRVRFDPKFNTVARFRTWAPNLTDLPPGWTINFGIATQFRTPVNVESSIATSPLPTSDPGPDSPNAGGETRLMGTGTQYSDWIVLQASVDTAVVDPGPILGFSTEGTLIPIEFNFVWIET